MSKFKVDITGIDTSKLEVLSNNEMLELFKQMKDGNIAAKERLINCNLKLVLSIISKYRYKNRFMRFIVEKFSKNPAIIEYEAEKRYSGESKYSFIKYLKLAINSIKAMNKINKNIDIAEKIYQIEKVI